MSLYTDLTLFLVANGVTESTAQQVSNKVKQKLWLNSNFTVEMGALADEFIKRGAKPGTELTQLKSVVSKSVARQSPTSSIGLKLGRKVSRDLLGDKTSYDPLLGWKVKPSLVSQVYLQPADIRQLANHVAFS